VQNGTEWALLTALDHESTGAVCNAYHTVRHSCHLAVDTTTGGKERDQNLNSSRISDNVFMYIMVMRSSYLYA
jgi:hypothetical protein